MNEDLVLFDIQLDDRSRGPFDATNANDLAWWLPVVGPTVTAIVSVLPRLAGQKVTVADLAFSVGVMPSALKRALKRMHDFHLGSYDPVTGVITVRTRLPQMTTNSFNRCPAWFQEGYRARVMRQQVGDWGMPEQRPERLPVGFGNDICEDR